MSRFLDEFGDLLTSEVTIHYGTVNNRGEFTENASSVNVLCRIEPCNRKTKSSTGQEIISDVLIFVDYLNLSVDKNRFTLPVEYNPRVLRNPNEITTNDDDIGHHHQEIYL